MEPGGYVSISSAGETDPSFSHHELRYGVKTNIACGISGLRGHFIEKTRTPTGSNPAVESFLEKAGCLVRETLGQSGADKGFSARVFGWLELRRNVKAVWWMERTCKRLW
jgi:hypothetical protein